MGAVFDKKQIVSSTEIVRSFKKYEDKELLEHVHIYEIIKQRKDSPKKRISLEKLHKKYGL